MQTLADMKKDFLNGILPIEADEYLASDGTPFCKFCNTPRLHIMPDGIHSIRGMCDCQYRAVQAAREKEKQEQLLMDYYRRKRHSEMPIELQDITFKNFISTEANSDALTRCINYLNNSQAMRKDNIGLYIFGDNSTGKTYISTCLCNELLLQGWSCLYTSMTSLIFQMDKQSRFDGIADVSILKKIKCFDFVFIDDLGKELLNFSTDLKSAKAIEKQVLSIINARAISGKPTIINSNYSKTELSSKLGIDKAISERINEMCPRSIKMSQGNFRAQIRDKKSDIAKRLGI